MFEARGNTGIFGRFEVAQQSRTHRVNPIEEDNQTQVQWCWMQRNWWGQT